MAAHIVQAIVKTVAHRIAPPLPILREIGDQNNGPAHNPAVAAETFLFQESQSLFALVGGYVNTEYVISTPVLS